MDLSIVTLRECVKKTWLFRVNEKLHTYLQTYESFLHVNSDKMDKLVVIDEDDPLWTLKSKSITSFIIYEFQTISLYVYIKDIVVLNIWIVFLNYADEKTNKYRTDKLYIVAD